MTVDTVETSVPQESGRRRMPESLVRHFVKVQGGKCYLPAAYRIVWFRDECADWAIETEIVEGGQEAGFATVKATIRNESGRVIATGHKTETRQDFPAGWVEKAESGSIARALGFVGFGTQFAPELDEAANVPRSSQPSGAAGHERRTSGASKVFPGRHESAPGPPPAEMWNGPGLCPQCHAPSGRKHVRPCSG